MRAPPPSLLAVFLVVSISIYRKTLSRYMLHSCRFFPSCSGYASECITTYGAAVGLIKSVCRILRCHPFKLYEFDPVT